MRDQLFYISFSLILLYLLLDVNVMSYNNEPRPFIAVIAGLGLLSTTAYNLLDINSEYSLFKLWPAFRIYLAYLVLFAIYFVLAQFELPTSNVDPKPRDLIIGFYIFNVLLFMYNATLRGFLDKSIVKYILIIALIYNGLMSTYYAYQISLLSKEEVINTSAGYVFVLILPFLLFHFKKQNILIFALTLLLTAITGKRGALVIYAFLIFYLLINLKAISSRVRINISFLMFGLFAVLVYNFFIENAYESLIFRILKLEDEYYAGRVGSGRGFFWLIMINEWIDSPHIVYKLFGLGYYSTRVFNGHIAHNDFIQSLVDMGIIGLFLWGSWLFYFLIKIREKKRIDDYLGTLLMFCFIILILRGMFSGTNRADEINLSISIGFLIGIIERKNLFMKINSK